MDMAWLWSVLAALAVFSALSLVFVVATRLLSPYATHRGSDASIVLRLRLLGGAIVLAGPVRAFVAWAPPFEGAAGIRTMTQVILIMAVSLIFLEGIIELLIHRFLSVRLGAGIPTIMTDLVKGIFYLVVIVVVLHDFFNINLTPFLTTSAIVTVILGLAFQDTLGNVIAGLALHFAAPYRVGDWIQVSGLEGKILRTDWRSTMILTRTNDAIVIPHVTMAKNEIYNFSAPSARHARELKIPVDYRYPPNQVIAALVGVARESEGILSDPEPEAYILSYQDDKAIYGLWVWIEDFEHLLEILNRLSTRIWYAIERGGITLGPAKRPMVIQRPEREDHRDTLLRFLRDLPMFHGVDDEPLAVLASKARLLRFHDREKIVIEGEKEQDFYILFDGSAAVLKKGTPFYRFVPGEFFGEMALLTGKPRTATIQAEGEAHVVLFKKEILAPLLEAHPPLLQKLSDAIVERLKTLPSEELSDIEEGEPIQNESMGTYIMRRIKNFFLNR